MSGGWSRFDSATYRNPKVLKAGTLAAGFWMLAGTWSRDNRTNGFVPRTALRQIAPDCRNPERVAARLVSAKLTPEGAGLFEPVEGGWRIHDFAAYGPAERKGQLSPEEISQIRREAGAKGLASRWGHKRDGAASPAVTPTVQAPPAPPVADGKPAEFAMASAMASDGLARAFPIPEIRDEKKKGPMVEVEGKPERLPPSAPSPTPPPPSSTEGHERVEAVLGRIACLRNAPEAIGLVKRIVASPDGLDVALARLGRAVSTVARKCSDDPDMARDARRVSGYLHAVLTDYGARDASNDGAPASVPPSAPRRSTPRTAQRQDDRSEYEAFVADERRRRAELEAKYPPVRKCAPDAGTHTLGESVAALGGPLAILGAAAR